MTSPQPTEELLALCELSLGARPERATEITPGLGHRRFLRLEFGQGARVPTAIARIEGPAPEPIPGVRPEPPLEPIRAFLEIAGLPVPRRWGAKPESGIELLEDVGDVSLERFALGAPGPARRERYAEACALIPRLQLLAVPGGGPEAFERNLDAALIDSKARKFCQWTLPAALDREASAGEWAVVHQAFGHVADLCESAPQRLAHRDFKAANLHLCPGPEGQRLVMIDLQGAFMAPPEYDLVCLLRDSHVRLPEPEIALHLSRTRPALPDAPDETSFRTRFELITLIRVAKDLSHYLHAARDRGDLRYLRFVPTALANLEHAARSAIALGQPMHDLAELVAAVVRRSSKLVGEAASGAPPG